MKRKHLKTTAPTSVPVTVALSITADKPHVICIGKHTLFCRLTEDEIKRDESFDNFIRTLPAKVQAFRILERRRDNASVELHRQQQEVDKLKRQLREACDEVRRHESTLDMAKDFLAVLSEDHLTNFRFPMKYDDCKAARKPNEKYYATSHCWMCGCLMGLEDFRPHRFFCSGEKSSEANPSNACAVEAKRRRAKMHRLANTKKPEPPPTKWPCPYCARPMTGEKLAKASRPHYLDPKEQKRFQREQQIMADVYGLKSSLSKD